MNEIRGRARDTKKGWKEKGRIREMSENMDGRRILKRKEKLWLNKRKYKQRKEKK